MRRTVRWNLGARVLRCGIDSLAFHIEIVRQGWLRPDDPDYDPPAQDLCTHGDIRLTIGEQLIAAGDGRMQYGISQAALGLLRTLEADTPDSDLPNGERLIPCGLRHDSDDGLPDWDRLEGDASRRSSSHQRRRSLRHDEGVSGSALPRDGGRNPFTKTGRTSITAVDRSEV